VVSRAFPAKPPQNSKKETRRIQTGANISQLFLGASSFLHLLFFAVVAYSSENGLNLFLAALQTRIDEKNCFE
jgi:hypothetical protein